MEPAVEKTKLSGETQTPGLSTPHKETDVATPSSGAQSVAETRAAQEATEEKDHGTGARADAAVAHEEPPQRSKLKIGLIMFSLVRLPCTILESRIDLRLQ
jgi:hypothetical protein